MSDPIPDSAEVLPPRASPPPSPPLQALIDQLETARKRIDDLARAYQASERDREEFKQRLNRERERLIDVEKGNVALALIEALDELDLCVANADDSPLARGVKLVRDNLLKKLLTTGIELMVLEGQPYDPNLAEAVDMEVTAHAEDDQKVTRVIRAGYKLKDRVVRPARVKVARYVTPALA
jgi:molecular chaperone GrpE